MISGSWLQQASRGAVLANPQAERGLQHPVWGGPGWKVYLDSREDVVRTIKYIEDNPIKIHRPRQHWPFVRPYDGWLPGQVQVSRPSSAKPQANPRRGR